jgi:S-DNA-T family DNA segregation ATPase FtsK/SpoIIIE
MAEKRRKKTAVGKNHKLLSVLLVLLALLIFISLATNTVQDDSEILSESNPLKIEFMNKAGIAGAYTSYILFFFLGWLAYYVPLTLIIAAAGALPKRWRSSIMPVFLFIVSVGILATVMINIIIIINARHGIDYKGTHGGYLSYHLTRYLMKVAGGVGSVVILGAGIITALLMLGYRYGWFRLRFSARLNPMGLLNRALSWIFGKFRLFSVRLRERKAARRAARLAVAEGAVSEAVEDNNASKAEAGGDIKDSDPKGKKKSGRTKITIKKPPIVIGGETADFKFPGLDLLTDDPEKDVSVNSDEIAATARSLKETLETFGITIEGQIDRYPGPVITRFEFKPAAGIKVNQITNLADDLALALKAKRIRIVAPIPGKAAVGVEIPNLKAKTVYLKDIIESDEYANANLRLPLAFGKNIAGKPFVADLAKMPHLLIAGATGSGKSVCINVLITSLIYRLHPRDLKFIFIDPKMLELSIYGGIPYLARPVVTNPKRAEKALAEAVGEMESRYKRLASLSVRNIEDYNSRQNKPEDKMPYIVIIVDELADMMIAASSSRIEMLITRLAQMARAVGIHLILATQRPSVDVITGLIKANFSARIAFQVASKIDSRTILDGNGAEKLLGNGDMLFLQPGQPEPIRLHGAFISSAESENIVKFVAAQSPQPEKAEETSEEADLDHEDDLDLEDPLFREAAETVVRHKQGSVSLLQRKLGIGYQRAARLIDKLEEAGIVSAYDGSKAREVLVDRTYLEKLASSRTLSDKNS